MEDDEEARRDEIAGGDLPFRVLGYLFPFFGGDNLVKENSFFGAPYQGTLIIGRGRN